MFPPDFQGPLPAPQFDPQQALMRLLFGADLSGALPRDPQGIGLGGGVDLAGLGIEGGSLPETLIPPGIRFAEPLAAPEGEELERLLIELRQAGRR